MTSQDFRRSSAIRFSLVVAQLCAGLAWLILAGSSTGYPHSGFYVVRIYYQHIRDLERLQRFDVWEYNNLEEGYVLAAVDNQGYETLIQQGFRVAIDEEPTSTMMTQQAQFTGTFEPYRSVDELYADLEALNIGFPQITEVVDYGQSYCLSQGGCQTPGGYELAGHRLRAMRVTNESIEGGSIIADGVITRGSKPVFFLMANIHAREITTPELAMRLLNTLTTGYGIDADITWIIDHHEIWVIPSANPDGHGIVEIGADPANGGYPFYQRKNADNDGDQNQVVDCPVWPPNSSEQFGVDLNRNHSFGWGPPGSSNQPCHMTYRGTAPASEIEVAQLETLIRALIPDQRGALLNDPAAEDTKGLFITLHSFGNLILWPWGHVYSTAPNYVDLKAIGDRFAFYNGYSSCQATSCLYAANGASDDWAYGELGIPAFTFEIGDDFMPAYGEIDSRQWPDIAPALLYGLKIARTPYRTIHGPEASSISISGQEPALAVTTLLNDQANGDQPIASARYSIDTPPWVGGVVFQPLLAADGAFDSSVESVTGSIVTMGLPAGRHMIFVQGMDDAGHWGPPSAAFFDFQVKRAYLPMLPHQ